MSETATPSAIPFRAETRQLLNILIHSLYTDREVFLRELISNSSDAITRLNFEMLTNRNVLDPETELGIWITANPDEKTLTIRDTGVGMNANELAENLGTIAHSGARDFLNSAQESKGTAAEIIGQFGVGFYSAFMVADSMRVTSRSYRLNDSSATWISNGEDTFTIEPAEKSDRGTEVTIKLKEDAAEFSNEAKLREIIKRHSDFIPYPIYLGADKQLVNQRTALWRQQPREVEAEKYEEFYRQFTLDFEKPITYTHMVADAPVQLYAMLFVPASAERTMFSLRKEDGLKLYARKVLIQEYSRDLLPEYFRFIQGIVDSEDLQLNVSRESIQSNRVISQIKRALTNRVLDMLKKLAAEPVAEGKPGYNEFWKSYSRYIKEGIATDRDSLDTLTPLLRYHTLNHLDRLVSLDEYIQEIKPDQKKIYYILGDDDRSILHSPHLDVFRHSGVDVLLMTDPLDSFVLITLQKYKDIELANASAEKPEIPAENEETKENESAPLPEDAQVTLVNRFKETLGDKIADVRTTDRLIDSPVRLVDKEGSMDQQVQRVYRMLQKEYEAPEKILEINPRHPILRKLLDQQEGEMSKMIIEQLYEDALLIEGLHPDPAGMISRIQELMKAALK